MKAKLEHILGADRVRTGVKLFRFVTLRTLTTADYLFEAHTREDLINAARASHMLKLPLRVIGGGTNIAVLKPNVSGLTVINRYQSKKILVQDTKTVTMRVSSGYPMARLVKETVEAGYAGVEYHRGLPGTVGGAVAMNSKWTHPPSAVGDVVESAHLLTPSGSEKTADRNYFRFAYDYSILKDTREIVLEVDFGFTKTDPGILKKRAAEAAEYRKRTQPSGVHSSGCFFKNVSEEERQRLSLPSRSAGFLIDRAGLKGASVGHFYVSEKHANFILNRGAGTPEDLETLRTLIRNKVKAKYGVKLEEEVIIV